MAEESGTELIERVETQKDVYGSPDRIVLNAGHAFDLEKQFPWLIEENVAERHTVTSDFGDQKLMSLSVEKLGKALLDHQDSHPPFAIEDILTVVGEELRQRQDPNHMLKNLKNDITVLENKGDIADPDEIEDFEASRECLQEYLETVPSQLLAVNGLLNSDDIKLSITAFMENYGNEQRKIKDLPTGKTHGEYLTGVLDDINASLQNHTEYLEICLPELKKDNELLSQQGITIPEDKIGEVLETAKAPNT